MQAALRSLATGQTYIERLGLQLLFKLGVGEGLATLVQQAFNGLLGKVDGSTTRFFLLH